MTRFFSSWPTRVAALCAFLALLAASGAWELRALRRAEDQRLEREARLASARISLYLANVIWEMDAPGARNALFIEMEDLRLAGVLLHDREGMLEGMRRNEFQEPTPWDDVIPQDSVEARAPVLMEEQPVGEVTVFLSRRGAQEEIAAAERRELLRLGALSLIPCLFLAHLLWQEAARRAAARRECDISPASMGNAAAPASPSEPTLFPPGADAQDAAARRAFMRDQRNAAARLYRAVAREDWGELRAEACALHGAALAIRAPELARAALEVKEAALSNTGAAARRVEHCVPVLARVFAALEASDRQEGM